MWQYNVFQYYGYKNQLSLRKVTLPEIASWLWRRRQLKTLQKGGNDKWFLEPFAPMPPLLTTQNKAINNWKGKEKNMFLRDDKAKCFQANCGWKALGKNCNENLMNFRLSPYLNKLYIYLRITTVRDSWYFLLPRVYDPISKKTVQLFPRFREENKQSPQVLCQVKET